MKWNYRVLRSVEGKVTKSYSYRIIEVYYDFAGNPRGWIESQTNGSDLKELDVTLKLMRGALKKPMLELKHGKLVEAE